MIVTVKSGAIVGIEAYLVQVEVDVAARESKERVTTAKPEGD
jgi:hypothetical protein